MRLSRRGFLAAFPALLAAACSRPGSSAAPQTFATRGRNVQVLDPDLRLAVPRRAMAPSSVTGFADRFGVDVTFVPPLSAAQFARGTVDVVMVDQETLAGVIDQDQVEPIDKALVANRKLIGPPFDDPPFDRGNAHSVPKDYTVVGFAWAHRAGVRAPRTWAGLFRAAALLPHQVAVPDDPAVVVGAALVAAGHDWNSDSSSDLDDARAVLLPLRGLIEIEGTVETGRLHGRGAVIATGAGYAQPASGVRFVVPADGTVARPRLLCIPAFAPDPVSAHAWLNHVLDPLTAAADTEHTDRATPVQPAMYALPPALLATPAVFPPQVPPAPLTFLDISASGLEARADIWQEMVAAAGTRNR